MSKKSDYVFGIHAVEQLLKKSPEAIVRAWMQRDAHSDALQQLKSSLSNQQVACETVTRQVLDKRVSGNHQGIVVEVKRSGAESVSLSSVLEASHEILPLFLVLDSVQDPHNLGACIRTAVAAGVTAVIIPKDRAASVNETVRKVASGGVEEMTIITVTNLVRALQELKQAGVWLVGTTGEAQQTIYDVDMKVAIAIVMGGEEKGLRHLVAKECDYLASIPLLGEIESLNVSVAAGVSLYEVIRQRRAINR